jgi:hypothetical protein
VGNPKEKRESPRFVYGYHLKYLRFVYAYPPKKKSPKKKSPKKKSPKKSKLIVKFPFGKKRSPKTPPKKSMMVRIP